VFFVAISLHFAVKSGAKIALVTPHENDIETNHPRRYFRRFSHIEYSNGR